MPSEIRGLPAAVPHPRHAHKAERATAATVAPAPEAPEETTLPAVDPVEESAATVDRSRRHVQRSLHQLDRLVRHEIKDRLREAGADPEIVRSYRDLLKDFRFGLKDAFHEAGRGGAFDRSLILPGIGEAVVSLTEGLRALRGGDDEVAEAPDAAETPEVAPVPDPIDRPDAGETVFVEPGGLLETTA